MEMSTNGYRSVSAWILLAVAVVFVPACELKQRSRVVFDPHETQVAKRTESVDTTDPPETKVPIPVPPPSLELLELATASTVRLVLENAEGSGVILGRDADGFVYVLTVWHCAKEGIDRVDFFNRESFPEPYARLAASQVVCHSERLDLAVVRVMAAVDLQFGHVPLMSSSGDAADDPKFAYSSGCGSEGFPTVLSERIIGKGRFEVQSPDRDSKGPVRLMWVTQDAQENGRSGGGLINVNGQLIGLALGKTDGKNGSSGYYCHFLEIFDYLVDNGLEWLVRCEASGN